MSRTYRRKNPYPMGFYRTALLVPEKRIDSWSGKTSYYFHGEYWDHYPTPEEMRKAKAVYHSDGFTSSFKEPGPSWFRRIDDTRPGRRKNKEELRKYSLDESYEPMCYAKGKLDWWT